MQVLIQCRADHVEGQSGRLLGGLGAQLAGQATLQRQATFADGRVINLWLENTETGSSKVTDAILDAAVRAQDAGVPLDDIQTITELGGANGYDTAEIIRLLDEETGQRGRATRGGAAASEGAAVDTGGGRADAGPSAESADGQPVKSIEAAPTFAGLDDLIAKYPDLTLTDEAGNEISARDMMAAAAEEVKAARELKPGIDALVACTLQYIGEAV